MHCTRRNNEMYSQNPIRECALPLETLLHSCSDCLQVVVYFACDTGQHYTIGIGDLEVLCLAQKG